MTFNIDKAKRIREHYNFLIGQPMGANPDSVKIFDIIIVPVDSKQKTLFIKSFWQTKNNDLSLASSGFDQNNVSILLITQIDRNFAFVKKEIDKFLTDKNLEKIYLKEDW